MQAGQALRQAQASPQALIISSCKFIFENETIIDNAISILAFFPIVPPIIHSYYTAILINTFSLLFLNPNPHVVHKLFHYIVLSVQYNNNEHNEFIYNELYI